MSDVQYSNHDYASREMQGLRNVPLPEEIDRLSSDGSRLSYIDELSKGFTGYKRLMLVGDKMAGKTVLWKRLTEDKHSAADAMDRTPLLRVEDWTLNCTDIRVFDFMDRNQFVDLSTSLHCAQSAVVLVFSLRWSKERIVESLMVWIRELHARVGSAPVLIVGTHADGLKKTVVMKTMSEVWEEVNEAGLPVRKTDSVVTEENSGHLVLYSLCGLSNPPEKKASGIISIRIWLEKMLKDPLVSLTSMPMSYMEVEKRVQKKVACMKLNLDDDEMIDWVTFDTEEFGELSVQFTKCRWTMGKKEFFEMLGRVYVVWEEPQKDALLAVLTGRGSILWDGSSDIVHLDPQKVAQQIFLELAEVKEENKKREARAGATIFFSQLEEMFEHVILDEGMVVGRMLEDLGLAIKVSSDIYLLPYLAYEGEVFLPEHNGEATLSYTFEASFLPSEWVIGVMEAIATRYPESLLFSHEMCASEDVGNSAHHTIFIVEGNTFTIETRDSWKRLASTMLDLIVEVTKRYQEIRIYCVKNGEKALLSNVMEARERMDWTAVRMDEGEAKSGYSWDHYIPK